jgi:hypothetical protein
MDIARMNLLCAEGLPGAEGLDVERCLTALAEMANRVRSETERHLYRFRQHPAEFENSVGFFRMLMMGVVLAEDFQVKYAPDKIASATEAHIGDGFFADARDVFIYGLTGSKRRGTCRQPIKMGASQGHGFISGSDRSG